MELHADRIAQLSGRRISELTRRDVAFGLLAAGADDALAGLPLLRRRLLAAGNPLSAAFWESAEAILTRIRGGMATTSDVQRWLEATGTEPNGIIGLHVWDDPPERSALQAEMHARLVSHLEKQVAAGRIDPDRLIAGDPAALRGYAEIQERWMTSPGPDGRVPVDVLLDEKDSQFLAEWSAADADALAALQRVLDEVGERPLPSGELAEACRAARTAIAGRGMTGRLLAACGGASGEGQGLPASDSDLWLTLAAGVVSPAGEAPAPPHGGPGGDGLDDGGLDEDGLDEMSRAMAALCALEHVDWLAAVSALVRGGPGTPASAGDMARYVHDYCAPGGVAGPGAGLYPVDSDPGGGPGLSAEDLADEDFGDEEFGDEEFDETAIAELFSYAATLWQALGATDGDERLTALGWWGLPEALRKVWASQG